LILILITPILELVHHKNNFNSWSESIMKKQILYGVIGAAILMFVASKVPAVKSALGMA